MDFKKSYDLLNAEMSKLKIKRTITICGGAALISSGYSSRATEDIDVLNETIDPELQKASDIIAMKPTEAELLEAKAWVLKRDAYEKWPQIVEECLSEIRRGLHG